MDIDKLTYKLNTPVEKVINRSVFLFNMLQSH